MIRAAIIGGLLAALAGQATAAGDVYDCHAVVGEPPVAVQVIRDYVDDKHVILRASMQVEGDIGYATDSTEPTALVTVANLVVDDDVLRLKFHYTDGAYEADVAEIAALHYQMRLHYARRERTEYFRYNQAIHEKIFEAARNSVLLDVYRKLSGRLRRARYAANLSNERWSSAMREHDEILDALSRRDARGLAALLDRHLRNKLEVVRQSLAQPSSSESSGAPVEAHTPA